MSKFYFGQIDYNSYTHRCEIEADSLEFAILKFAYTKDIFCYLNEECYKEGNYTYEYCDGSGYKYFFKDGVLENAHIDVIEKDEKKNEWKVIKSIPYKELTSINFKETELRLSKEKGSTEGSTELMAQNKSSVTDYKNLPVEFSQGKVKTLGDYTNVRIDIQRKIVELEQMKQELSDQISEMEKWLQSKYRVICAFETYLGTYEEVVELIGEGNTSDKPIHFYQMVLYMDEEYGLVNLQKMTNSDFNDEYDFDYHHISFFDNWIKEHYKEYIPEERGIRMWRIKRYNKDYKDHLYNMVENERNKNCYFLIRNGERLYRVFSDVRSSDGTMFPTDSQSEKAGRKWYEDKGFDKEIFEQNMLPWKYILVALQGLLDRTDILGTDCQMKYNLLTGFFDPTKIILVRDKEYSNLIEDKTMPSWREYVEKNRSNIKVGDRVIITDLYYERGGKDDSNFIYSHNMDWRRRYCDKPSTNLVYQIKDVKDDMYKILYFESDLWWNEVPRKKRTACWLDKSEVFDLSNTTREDLLYYLNDRRNREDYLDYLPIFHLALKYLTAKAFEREDYYKKFEND